MKIGLFVGHSRKGDTGACDYTGKIYEWNYNSALIKELKDKLIKMGISEYDLFFVNDYKAASYSKAVSNVVSIIKEERIDLAIEFHFNSADDKNANGFEYIYFDRSPLGKKYATKFAEAHKNTINSAKTRGDNGIVSRGVGRGAAMLKETPCPFIIAEPFFGSNKKEADFFLSPEGRLALIEVYAKAIIACYGRVSDPYSGKYVDIISKLDEANAKLDKAKDSPSMLNTVLDNMKAMLDMPPFKTARE